MKVAITGDYNIEIPDRDYSIGDTIKINNRQYKVINLGNRLVYVVEIR